MDLKFYFSLFLRRLHWFLLFFLIGSALGLSLARMLPPVYKAEARLLLQAGQLGSLAPMTVQTQAAEQLQIIRNQITTRDALIEMANRLEIYGAAGSAERLSISSDEIVEDMRNRIGYETTGIAASARSRAPVNTVVIDVSFEAENPQLAATVTNELVTRIQEENRAQRTGQSGRTLAFFEQEVLRLDQELSEAGRRILEFKQANQDALPDSLDFRRSQLAANQERMLILDRDQTLLQDQRDQMVRLHEALSANRGTTPDRPLTEEERQLRELQEERTTRLAVLSEENPRIKMLDARIDALEKVIASKPNIGTEVLEGGQLSAYQLRLAELDSRLDFVKLQKEQLQTANAELTRTIEETSGNAIALDTLQRDYDNTERQYNDAVARRAQAETGDTVEALGQGQRIIEVEQAVVPSEPASPNRLLIAGGGMGAGFMLGLAVVVLLELIRGGVRRPVDLQNKLGITPLATLPYMRSRREAWIRRVIILSAMAAVLIGIPLLLWAVHTYYLPLDLLIQNVLGKIGLASVSPGAGSAATFV